MKYFVCWKDYLLDELKDPNKFLLCEEDIDCGYYYLNAKNKEDAVKKFLLFYYDNCLVLDEEIIELNERITKEFLLYCIYGDDFLDRYSKSSEIENLKKNIIDDLAEMAVLNGDFSVSVNLKNNIFDSQYEVSDKFTDVILEKYASCGFLNLLTKDELKAAFIKTFSLDITCILLSDI